MLIIANSNNDNRNISSNNNSSSYIFFKKVHYIKNYYREGYLIYCITYLLSFIQVFSDSTCPWHPSTSKKIVAKLILDSDLDLGTLANMAMQGAKAFT